MAVKIRLARAGAKKHPIYHLVVADERRPRDGRFIETIGLYDPTASKLEVNKERYSYWLQKGAIPTVTIKQLIKRALKAQPAAHA